MSNRSCSIEISSHDLEPAEVSRRLGVDPTTSFKRGDIRGRSSTSAITGGWRIDSSERTDARHLEDHLDWLAGFVREHRPALIGLRESGFTVRARIAWTTADEVLSASIDPNDLATLVGCVESIELSVV